MADRYDIVALTSNDLVTDQRMQRCIGSLSRAGYRCLLLGRERPASRALDRSLPFDQERHRLSAHAGKRLYYQLNRAHHRRLLALRPRAILVVDLDTVLAGAEAARVLAVPWVYDAHELFTEQPEVARRPWIRVAWSLVGKRYVGTATAAYTVGEAIARELTDRYARPFEVVRNLPVASLAAAPSPLPRANSTLAPKAPFTVLYQGALNEARGLEELIDAAAELDDVRVVIAGDGPLAADLRERSRTSDGDVTFLGELPPAALREVTPTADLGYALMRDVSLNYRLSLSNKSLDYLQSGLPSLQMAWPEYITIQQRYGCYHLVDTLSPRSVVDAIEACRDEAYAARLRRGCVRAARELTWTREEGKLLSLWRSVLALGGPS